MCEMATLVLDMVCEVGAELFGSFASDEQQ